MNKVKEKKNYIELINNIIVVISLGLYGLKTSIISIAGTALYYTEEIIYDANATNKMQLLTKISIREMAIATIISLILLVLNNKLTNKKIVLGLSSVYLFYMIYKVIILLI